MSAFCAFAAQSFAELCAYAIGGNPARDPCYARIYGPNDEPKFYGHAGPLEQVTTDVTNWPEGVERLRAEIERLDVPALTSVRRRGVWADQGDTVDMSRMYAGHFERAFRSTRRVASAQAPRVRLFCNIGALVKAKSADMFYRGAAAAVLCEMLSTAGYAVELSAVSYALAAPHRDEGPPRGVAIGVLIKPFEAPLSFATVASLLTHTATFRRIVFAARARLFFENAGSSIQESLGFSQAIDSAVLATLFGARETPTERVVIVPNDLFSREAANAFIRSTIDTLSGGTGRAA